MRVRPSLRSLSASLSARLLVLTVAFVMLAEVLIFVPSVARFRLDWLEQRLAEAALAALTVEAAPQGMVTPMLETRLLAQVGAHVIDLIQPGGRVYMLAAPTPPTAQDFYDLRLAGTVTLIGDALTTLVRGHDRVIEVAGMVPRDPSAAAVVLMDEGPLRAALIDYAGRILALSVVISLVTAGLVFFSLHRTLVGPMRRITASMTAFREDPEDPGAVMVPGARTDEVGIAERELAAMQDALRTALRQKARLAALGTAVAKINHDLGNILSTASLVSERLVHSADPEVLRITPRLLDALDRAVALCRQTLSYCRDGVVPLRRSAVAVRALVARAAGEAGGETAWDNRVAADLNVAADPDQMTRALVNLGRNAIQAGATRVTVTAVVQADRLGLTIADDGPGLPARARDHLFQPFQGAVRSGGTGLGLAIAREILRAHGGDVKLVDTGPAGTTFAVELPITAPER